MSIFIIKIIACITMVLDHIKYIDHSMFDSFITVYFGRVSYPLFAFLLTEGYIHTTNLKKYYTRIIVFGIISQIPFMLFRTLVGEWKMLNIMFTLLLGLVAITIYDKEKRKYISLPIVALLIYLGKVLKVDYGWFGVSLVFIFYLCKDKKILLFILYSSTVVSYLYYLGVRHVNEKVVTRFIVYMIPLIIVYFYNGKLGKKTKYFYYLFYPIHMLIIYLIRVIAF